CRPAPPLLLLRRMRWLVVLALCAASSLARADGYYFTEGVGGTTIKDDLAAAMPGALRIRVSVGRRTGHWATELFMAGDLPGDTESTLGFTTGGIDVKYIQPLASHLEIYLRGSATLGALDGPLAGYAGRGLGFGAGIQLKGRGSVWGLAWLPAFFLIKSG